jgi:hypothetical protein
VPTKRRAAFFTVANGGEGLGQDLVQGFPGLDARLELRRLGLQLGVGKFCVRTI